MVYIYKIKFTILQQEILRFLFMRAGETFNVNSLAVNLKVSQTAIAKAIPFLEKEELIQISRDRRTKRISIKLNRENKKIIYMKRVDNLRNIYESGLAEFLTNSFPGATLIIFGSYSTGEDTTISDIDIAVISQKQKDLDLTEFEKKLERKISLEFYATLKEINKNLRENILNGIIIKGGVEL